MLVVRQISGDTDQYKSRNYCNLTLQCLFFSCSTSAYYVYYRFIYKVKLVYFRQ